MIDTDKYEGHTPADEWEIHLVNALFETEFPMTYADNQLMADAPLLLAEVKRLRKQIKDLEYEVEHWKWELQTRMCPIEFDALVNGDEEE